MHVTLVTRHDLLPAVHGAAVKVVRTAEAMSRLGVEVTIVTGDREHYHLYQDGNHSVIPYAPRWIAATRIPERLRPLLNRLGVPDYWQTVEGLLDSLGYPRDEHILYQPLVDPEFWLRTLYVGIRHGTDWFQAEFPGFGAPAWVAARILRRKCSVVQHNVEWKRLEDTTELPQETIDRLRGIELQLCHLADEVITCSDDDRTLMLPDDFERDEITVIPHGVERSMFVGKTGAGVREHFGIPQENALLFFLVFGMSATVDIHMLVAQLRNAKAILMGVFLQFCILPLCGFLVVKFFELERSVGISLLVVTSSPGGSYSNW